MRARARLKAHVDVGTPSDQAPRGDEAAATVASAAREDRNPAALRLPAEQHQRDEREMRARVLHRSGSIDWLCLPRF